MGNTTRLHRCREHRAGVAHTAALLAALALTLTSFGTHATTAAATPQAQAQAEALTCIDGFAGQFPCAGVDLLAFMPLAALGAGPDTRAANLWGWTDPDSGREYLLLGLTDATAFVDLSDPLAPRWLGSLPTHTSSSTYRDIKVYGHHAFIIADLPSLHGMQVFDLHALREAGDTPVTFTEAAHFDGFGDAHNLHINTDSGYAYVMRTTTPDLCGGAMYMVDIRDPLQPAFAGCYGAGGLASDAMCVLYHGDDPQYQGRELCLVASDDDIIVADVSDKLAPLTLATLGYADIARAHNAWLTDDHNYFVSVDMNDELQAGLNTRVFVWDFRDVSAPALIGIYQGPTAASDHNIWVRGTKAYVGNFRAGLRILDLAGITSGTLSEDAFFDLIPEDDNPGHHGGAWAAYPFFPSRVIAVSDKETGLYLLRRVPKLYAQIEFRYAMDDGSTGGGVYTLWDDWVFTDSDAGSGEWTLRLAAPRMVLQYPSGQQCAARSVVRLLGEGVLGGPRVCEDDSQVRGVWRGTLREGR